MSDCVTEIALETLDYISTYPVVGVECAHQIKAVASSALYDIKKEMTRPDPTPDNVLQAAMSHILERGGTYDSEGGERSMSATVQAFNAITGHELKESQGWLFMVLLKAARANQKHAYHADSFEDMAAYVALAAEAKAAEGTI